MDIINLIGLNFIGLSSLVFLLYFFSTNVCFEKERIVFFKRIALVNLLLIVLDILEYVTEFSMGQDWFYINQFLICLCYICNPILPFLLLSWYLTTKKEKNTANITVSVTSLVAIVMTVLSITNDGKPIYLKIAMITQSIVSFAFFVTMLFKTVSKMKISERSDKVFLIIIFLVVLTAFVLESIFDFRFVLWNISVICLVLFYSYLHTIKLRNDTLTDCPNRFVFEKDLNEEHFKGTTCVAVFDVNNLKLMNDTQGHLFGDKYLCDIAMKIKAAFTNGKVYRIGGDEFVFIGEVTEEEFGKMSDTFYALIHKDAVSVGYAFSTDGANLVATFKLADDRMYEAKEKSKQGR